MMSILRVCYIFFVTLIGLLLLYQQSIAIYWQQTYHRSMPLFGWQDKPFLSSIAKLNQQLLADEDIYFSAVADFNDQLVQKYNHLILETKSSQDEHVFDHVTYDSKTNHEDEPTSKLASKQTALEPVHAKTERDEAPPLLTTPTLSIKNEAKNDEAKDVTIKAKSSVEMSTNLKDPVQQVVPITVHPVDKILFIGDSLMQGVAPRVKRSLYQKYHIESLDLSKQSTGLSYPGAFNWPKTVEDTLAQEPSIKVVVVFLGPNDPWNFPVKGHAKYLQFKSAQWEATYRYRINRILKAAQLNKADVIWLGVPCMRKAKLHRDVVYLNTLYHSEVAKIGGHYIPTSELLGCSDKEYANFVTTNKGNAKVRIDDGIHFSVLGQKILANRIINEMTIESAEQKEAIQ
ncbi:SGNH family hydrolase [Orbus sturtevantii]|uniref:SGNH/GDSL hydrolase family protein n=1 Tax=Orbus sturtevantii TaxID=3074109 RepID=UPI00370DB098